MTPVGLPHWLYGEVSVSWLGLSPGYGGEMRRRDGERWVSAGAEKPGQEFAKGHLEQHGKAVGTLTIAGERFDVDADRRRRSRAFPTIAADS